MTNENFGANPNDPNDPLIKWLRSFGMSFESGEQGGSEQFSDMVGHLQQAFNASTAGGADSVWTQTRQQIKAKLRAEGGEPPIEFAFTSALLDANRLANSWLDEVMSFEAVDESPQAWTREDWVDKTMPAWRKLAEPISQRIADEVSSLYSQQFDQGEMPSELAGLVDMVTPMMRSSAQASYAQHIAAAIAELAEESLSGAEINMQVFEPARVVLLPANIAAFSEGLGISSDDVFLYLVVREAARQRLFVSVSWLGPQLMVLVEHYAREIKIDPAALTANVDPSELSKISLDQLKELSTELEGRLFSPTNTPTQLEILARLETLLALVEGWVDEVSRQCLSRWMPQASVALDEALRRRRATNDPAAKIFGTLVGLELHPRKVREAMKLWQIVTEAQGIESRDALWAHPDLIPTADDLADPLGLLDRKHAGAQSDEMDDALAQLLAEEAAKEDPDNPERPDAN